LLVYYIVLPTNSSSTINPLQTFFRLDSHHPSGDPEGPSDIIRDDFSDLIRDDKVKGKGLLAPLYMMSLRDVVLGKNKFLAENVFLAAPKTNSWLSENISRAAPKINSWLKMFFWLPQKQIPLAENVFLAARKNIFQFFWLSQK
jgi:hypothetical protein